MGNIRSQRDSKSEDAKGQAQSANSVPELKAAVVLNSEAIQRLEAIIAELTDAEKIT